MMAAVILQSQVISTTANFNNRVNIVIFNLKCDSTHLNSQNQSQDHKTARSIATITNLALLEQTKTRKEEPRTAKCKYLQTKTILGVLCAPSWHTFAACGQHSFGATDCLRVLDEYAPCLASPCLLFCPKKEQNQSAQLKLSSLTADEFRNSDRRWRHRGRRQWWRDFDAIQSEQRKKWFRKPVARFGCCYLARL